MRNRDWSSVGNAAVLIDGCRIPFARSNGDYGDALAYDLARTVIKGLLNRNDFDAASIDRIILGTVIQNVQTSNVAREASLAAGVPASVPANTVTMACISANLAAAGAMDLIRCGRAQTVIAGGTESLSDVPVGLSKQLRDRLLRARKAGGPLAYLGLLKGLRPRDLLPRAPAIAEFSTGRTMGESADRLAAMFGITRELQDEYALRSHRLAANATREEKLSCEVVPAAYPPGFKPLAIDNTIREDSSLEKLAGLEPAFVKPFGTVTAGNSSPLTDGASAVLVMAEERARANGHVPRATLRDYVFVAQEPGDELLLGPAYAVPELLTRAGLQLDDIDVIELHEAFAGQLLAVVAALDSDAFARERLGRLSKVGAVDMDKVNLWGGSLSLGHPFGATGTRLLTTAANRLHDEDGQLALVSACAAGGMGVAMLLERYRGEV